MNNIIRIAAMLMVFLTIGATNSPGQSPKMKMTTPIPEGIATPDKLKTHLGTLTSFDGVPHRETTQKIYDDLDLRRATEAFLATLPVASMSAMEKGLRTFGPANTTALLFEDLMDSKSLWLTPNTVSIYQVAWVELGDEPMVIETPPKVLGIIDDAWFQYVADFGNAGPDKGQGGHFLAGRGIPFSASTVRCNRFMTKPGSQAIPSWWNNGRYLCRTAIGEPHPVYGEKATNPWWIQMRFLKPRVC